MYVFSRAMPDFYVSLYAQTQICRLNMQPPLIIIRPRPPHQPQIQLHTIHCGSVLIFKQEDLCSTLLFPYYSSRRKSTSTLRVIALQAGRSLLYELLFELYLAINNSSTNHFSKGKNTSTLRVITLHWEYSCSTSYSSMSYYSPLGMLLLCE
jgi:hypothetical protein